MSLNQQKFEEFFDPNELINGRIHIIGCGAVGSILAENLARIGVEKFSLYDFDKVEQKNIANQLFTTEDLGLKKIDAVKAHILSINPDADVSLFYDGWTNERLNGYVFACPDNIEVRKAITNKIEMSVGTVKAYFDIRTGLTCATAFAADPMVPNDMKSMRSSQNFTHEEALAASPRSACGEQLSFAPVIRMIVASTVANFVNFLKNNKNLKTYISIDAFNFMLDAFPKE